MNFFKNGTGWCKRHNPNKKKATSSRSHAPIFRQQAFKRSSAQALEPGNTGRKPDRQGFKPQAIIYKIQYPVSRVQAYKLGVRGPGNKDK